MRIFAFLLISCCLPFYGTTLAQDLDGHFEEWGKVTMDDLNVTECAFDKKADAILLLDLGQMFFEKQDPSFFTSGRYLITSSYYQRYKVLTEKGTDEANFSVTFFPGNKGEVINIKAICYNLENGEIRKVELKPADILTSKLTDHESKVVFSVPGVKKGSVFEVQYSRREAVSNTLPTWYFTSSVPSLKSSLTVGFFDALDYYEDKHILTKKFEEKTTPYYSGIYVTPTSQSGRIELIGHRTTYTTHDLPAYKDEEYINSAKNYENWIGFQLRSVNYPINFYANTYKDNINPNIINSYDKLNEYIYGSPFFIGNLEMEPISKKLWEPLITDKMTEEEKASVIFDFIRSNMTATSPGGFRPASGNIKIWKDKTGSSTEINILLINTLRRAGCNAYPILVGSRSKGYINKYYPVFNQFENVMAVLELDNGNRKIILDAGDKYTPFGITPYDLLNTYGLALKSKEEKFWYPIFENSPDVVNVLITCSMDENNKITGDISISGNNYSATRYKTMKARGNENAIKELAKKDIPNTTTIESMTDTFNSETGKYLQKIIFSSQPLTDNDGNVYISLPAIYGMQTNPFASEERTCDIDIGYMRKENIIMNLTIPGDYSIDSITRSMKLILPDTSISFSYHADGQNNMISMVQKLQFTQSFFRRSDYPSVYDFFQKYFDLRQRPVILKKKA